MSLPWFLVFRSHLSNIHIPTFIPHHVSNSALHRDVNITGVLTNWMCEKQQVPTLSSLPALATLELNIGHNTGAEGSSSARVAKQTQGRAICSHRGGMPSSSFSQGPWFHWAHCLEDVFLFIFLICNSQCSANNIYLPQYGAARFLCEEWSAGPPCECVLTRGGGWEQFLCPDPGQEAWRACCPRSN